MAAHIATLQQRLGVALRGNLINCWFVLDNSGSMAGQKWNLARYQDLRVQPSFYVPLGLNIQVLSSLFDTNFSLWCW
jgi:hypothetical protein